MGPKVESSNIFFHSFYGLGIKTSRFQLKDRNSILLTSKVEGLFYLFALSIVIFGVMVIAIGFKSYAFCTLIIVVTFIGASVLFILLWYIYIYIHAVVYNNMQWEYIYIHAVVQ